MMPKLNPPTLPRWEREKKERAVNVLAEKAHSILSTLIDSLL